MLEQIVSKALQAEETFRFFLFNHMNVAVKFSNLITREILNIELKLTINQMHD
jgi:hypothetical protein